jgi:carboxyl-terminal processing protease
MPRILGILGALVLGGAIVAAPVADSPVTSPAPLTPEEAQNYAEQLLNFVINPITQQYVRPVTHAELMAAALGGMYSAARQPIPTTLRDEIEKANTQHERFVLLRRVRESLGNPEALQGSQALLVSIRALTPVLDPHSVLTTETELRRAAAISVNLYGIGVEIDDGVRQGAPRLKAVLPGSPAQRAGLRPGDRVIQIDGQRAASPTDTAVQQALASVSPDDTGIKQPVRMALAVLSSNGRERQLVLERQSFRPETVWGVGRRDDNSWDYWLDKTKKIAQIRLGPLTNGTAEELQQVLGDLEIEGVKGLILDLRWCPGGYLNEAISAADLFLDECTIATVKNRAGIQNEYGSTRDNSFLNVPLAILVNGETSGGAELIAAALQDHKRGIVVGQRTLGKGSIQDILPLPMSGVRMRLTKGLFVRPSGKNLHRFPDSKPTDDWGVVPDPRHQVRLSPELGRQLREWWQWQTLRPGPSQEVLPLDLPESDPQRQAAFRVLTEPK